MSKRPLRELFEEKVGEVPSGPLGKSGGGNLVGAGGFIAVEATRPIIDFIPGLKQPGYSVSSHGAEEIDGGTRHTVIVNAISKNIAEFVAKYESIPSNIDYLTSEPKIVSIEEMESKETYSMWRIIVDVTTRGDTDG